MAQRKRKVPAKRSTKKGFFNKKAGKVAKTLAWEPGTKTKAGSTRKTVAKRIGTTVAGAAAGGAVGAAANLAAGKAGAKGKGKTAATVAAGGLAGQYAVDKITRNKTRKYRSYSTTPVGKARKAVGKFEDKALAKGARGIKKGTKSIKRTGAKIGISKGKTYGAKKGGAKTGFITYKRKTASGKTISVRRKAGAKRKPTAARGKRR